MKTLIQNGIIAAYYPDESVHWENDLVYIPDAVVRATIRNAQDVQPAPDPCESAALDDVKAWYKKTLNWLAERRMNAGFMHNSSRFQSDNEAMQNITGTGAAIGMGMALPPGFAWRDADNVMHTMTAAEFGQLAGAALTFRNTVYGTSWYFKGQIESATTLAEVRAKLVEAGAALAAIA
jgi:hypothetical protein